MRDLSVRAPDAASEPAGVALRRGASRLAAAGIDQPRREARLLLGHALGRTASGLLDPAEPVSAGMFDTLIARRASRVPMAHILGRQGFWTLDLEVSPATLIPRADSETLIEAARDHAPPRPRAILDLGTGSGALLLAALTVFPNAWGVGVDRCTEALAVARRNAHANRLSGRAHFVAGDWDAALHGQFDVVLSNPPYIRRAAVPTLMPEVAEHEPRGALDGGVDGLDAYRALIPRLAFLMARPGVAVLEVGAGQAGEVQRLAGDCGCGAAELRHDLGGIARAVVLRSW